MEEIRPNKDTLPEILDSVERATFGEEEEIREKGNKKGKHLSEEEIRQYEEEVREQAGFRRKKFEKYFGEQQLGNQDKKETDLVKKRMIDLLSERLEVDKEIERILEEGLSNEEVLKIINYEFRTAEIRDKSRIIKAVEFDLFFLKQQVDNGVSPEPIFEDSENIEDVIEDIYTQTENNDNDIQTGINLLVDLKKRRDNKEFKERIVDVLILTAFAYKLECLIEILESKFGGEERGR